MAVGRDPGRLKVPFKLILILAARPGNVHGDGPVLAELNQVLVQGLHPLPPGHLYGAVQLVSLAFTDQVFHGVVAQHHLEGGHPTSAFGLGQELLVHDSLQNGGQLGTNLRL